MSAKFSDIIPPNKRSIRNVPLNISVEDKPTHVKQKTLEKDTRELMKIVKKQELKVRSKIIWGVAIFCTGVLSLVIASKFASATVTIVSAIKPIVISTDLNLSHSGTSTNSVDYDVLTMSLSEPIPNEAITVATGTSALGTKASGSVTIYNNYSSASQILIKNTRLESPDGKIFFLAEKVTVPGQTKNKSGVLVPGSIVAKIIAEKDGAAYNVGNKDFTFPGLKSSSKYKTIYAKAKTAIEGGAAPKAKVNIDQTVLGEIQDKLKLDAQNQINAQKSDDYIIIPGGMQESLTIDGTSTAKLAISVLLIKKTDLAIQLQTIKNLDLNLSAKNSSKILVGTSELKMTIPQDLKLTSLVGGNQVKIGLSGTTTISSDLSAEVLKNELAGQSFDNAQKILKNKIGVDAINLEISPWWVKTIPSNPKKINIKIENN